MLVELVKNQNIDSVRNCSKVFYC